jgi:tetratricopeptide (TPR) repeat protein
MLRYLIASKEDIIESEINEEQSEIALLILYGLKHEKSISQIASKIRRRLGEADFEILETSLIFADLGLFDEARKIVKAVCVDGVPKAERGFLPLYYLAWYSAQCKDKEASKRWLEEAAATSKDFVFASRVEELDILQYAVKENPTDSQAHLQLGCLLAHLGRVEEAIPPWEKSAELNPKSSIAWRNLGLAAIAKDDSSKAIEYYRKAIAARRSDQTLFRDLATILIASDRRREAIELLETMPHDGPRRAEITMILAESYVAEARYGDCVKLLESALYFVNWEGSDDTWRLFNRAHIERGRQSLEKDDAKSALADFEAALTYPANLNVGRSNKPEEAEAQYWRGKSLAALDRKAEAQAAWKAGAEGFDGVKPSLQPGIPSLKSTQIEFRQKCIDALKEQK